jgi:hypothetical protein
VKTIWTAVCFGIQRIAALNSDKSWFDSMNVIYKHFVDGAVSRKVRLQSIQKELAYLFGLNYQGIASAEKFIDQILQEKYFY